MEENFYVYVIENELNKIYIGHTSDIRERLDRHNKILPNKSKSYTFKNSGFWRLVYKEEFKTRKEAMNRERQLKSYQGRLFVREKLNKK